MAIATAAPPPDDGGHKRRKRGKSGRFVKQAKFDATEIGRTGVAQTGGWILEEIAAELKGNRWTKNIQEMIVSPLGGSVCAAIQQLMAQVEWRIEPKTPKDAEQSDMDLAERYEENHINMETSWSEVIGEVLSYLPWGWGWHEILYRMGDDNRVEWQDFPPRAQQTKHKWEFDPKNGKVLGFWQDLSVTNLGPGNDRLVFIPIEKSLHFKTTTNNRNPDGRSILRPGFLAWYAVKHLERIQLIGIERDLTGLVVVRGPGRLMDPNRTGDDTAVYNKLVQIARDVKVDEQMGIVLPSDRDDHDEYQFTIELLSTDGQRTSSAVEALEYHTNAFYRTTLSDVLKIGQQAVGSYALADAKTNLFAMSLGAYLDQIADVFNRQAIPRLLEINGDETDNPPTLKHGDLEVVDIQNFMNGMKAASDSGFLMFPDKDVQAWGRAKLGMPIPTPEEFEQMEQEAEEQKVAAQEMAQAQLDGMKAGIEPGKDDREDG